MTRSTAVAFLMIGLLGVSGAAVVLPGLAQEQGHEGVTPQATESQEQDRRAGQVIAQAMGIVERLVDTSWDLYRRTIQPKVRQFETEHALRIQAERHERR